MDALKKLCCVFLLFLSSTLTANAGSLDKILADGELRHLAIPYARFNTGDGDGLDIELMQGFAAHLGVKYRYVETGWSAAFEDLLGVQVKPNGDAIEYGEVVPIRGDVLASGITKLEWREQVIAYSDSTFPSAVWLIARPDLPQSPIKASGDLQTDMQRTRDKLTPQTRLLSKPRTCLDASLYQLDGLALIEYSSKIDVNEVAPAVIQGVTDTALLDVPDALIALEKWAGQIKVLGPISGLQEMGVVFRQEDNALREAFNAYFRELVRTGRYQQMVDRYYPNIRQHFPEFFAALAASAVQ